MIESEHYDIVFLDHMMPEMDGIETLQRAKKLKTSQCQDTPFIALTANAVAGVKDRFLEQGFDDYLSKPVDGKTLERMVQKYLPLEKIAFPVEDEEEEIHLIDLPTAMKYAGNDEAMQKKFLTIFVSRRESVIKQLENDLITDNIADYATHVHALKSTSMSIGGLSLSETAKDLEMAGRAYCDGPDEEKEKHLQFIKVHHQEMTHLYQQLAEEAQERFGIS